jgi:hypothetical protein
MIEKDELKEIAKLKLESQFAQRLDVNYWGEPIMHLSNGVVLIIKKIYKYFTVDIDRGTFCWNLSTDIEIDELVDLVIEQERKFF